MYVWSDVRLRQIDYMVNASAVEVHVAVVVATC